MRKLLGSSDELVVGNAALCLGHCLAVQGTATSLLGTDCVMLLLRYAAGKSKRVDVQQNAAIALGKLCRVEPRYAELPFLNLFICQLGLCFRPTHFLHDS